MSCRFGDLKARLCASFLALAVLVLSFLFIHIKAVTLAIALLLAALSYFSVGELMALGRKQGEQREHFPSILAAVFALSFGGSVWFPFPFLPVYVFFCGLFLLFVMRFSKVEGAFSAIAGAIFALVYVALPLGLMLWILFPPPFLHFQEGRAWLLFLIITTKMTDIGAYFGGKFWGKKKLARTISPGKTRVGLAVGLLACCLSGSICFLFMPISFLQTLFLSLGLGLAGQLGDLSESLLKRDANVKDSGHLPGFGGILDLVDAFLFSTPLLFSLLLIWGPR